jgi:nitrogenase molybdenum-iron protein beta chain
MIEQPRYTCALGGALASANAIGGLVPILHSGPGCGTQLYLGQINMSGYQGAGYCGGFAVPSSNTYEEHIVFGGETRLLEQIEHTKNLIDAEQFIVLTGCTGEIIGDDVKGVVSNFNDLLYAETPGFKGNSYRGYDLLLCSLIENLTREQETDPRCVNLFGIVPSQDVFWQGNLEEITRLLQQLGLTVNTFFNPQGLREIKNASKAALNILLSPWHGLNTVKRMKTLYNTPYLTYPMPLGATDTSDFLRRVGETLDISSELVDEVLREEEDYYYSYINRVADVFANIDVHTRFAVIADSNYATAITRFLANDFGQIPAMVAITDDTPEFVQSTVKQRIQQLDYNLVFDIIFETDTYRIWKKVKETSPSLVLGSALDRDFCDEYRIPHLSISFPMGNRVILNRSYAGYRGAITLIEDVLSLLCQNR